ncbi:MAG: VWA domain-containing protein [Oscillospiraceae bacterium]|nr:VWA domain-containing protein [Oscillospiraceae bacterium]
MADPAVYSEKLSYFSRMLRREGLTVGPQETADACQILIHLGLEDRQAVKTALRTVFAKSREEQLTFDRVFDGFFISEEAMREQAKKQMEREQEQAAARQEAEQDLQGTSFSEEQKELYAAMSQEQRQKLRDIKKKFDRDIGRNHPGLYGNFIHSVFARAMLEQQMLMEDAGSQVDAADPELGLLYRDISRFRDTEIPKAIHIIQDISRKINGELTAKRKNRAHSGKLDFRRTIRKGLETGGSLYNLKFKRKRQRKKHLVLLCDVSGSMMQFSEFALRFIQSLNQASDSSRVFLFSESVAEADAFSLQNMDLFRNYVREQNIYGKGTDLGTALAHLCTAKPAPLGAATTLLILSDTKTIDQPRAIRALLEAKRQAGKVIWLNPIPESKWGYLRSVQVFASLVTMVSCSTLHDLAQACKRLADQ